MRDAVPQVAPGRVAIVQMPEPAPALEQVKLDKRQRRRQRRRGRVVEAHAPRDPAPRAETLADERIVVRQRSRGKRQRARDARAAREARQAFEARHVREPEKETDSGEERRRFAVGTPVEHWARGALVAVVVGTCGVLPFAVPAVSDFLGRSVPSGLVVAQRVPDPPVGPPDVDPDEPLESTLPAQTGGGLLASGRPLEVVVPRLRVASTVRAISGQSGSLTPPDDPQVLGWWKEGRRAGEAQGSMVITGHTVHNGGGAFDSLDVLTPGDRVRVRTTKGWIGYVVQRNQTYSTAALARNASAIFRLEGPGRLVLITCDDWNGSVYLSNAVVYAAATTDEPFR